MNNYCPEIKETLKELKELKIEIEKFNKHEVEADMSWAREGLFYHSQTPDYNNILFSADLFKEYPIILSKHCSVLNQIEQFKEFVEKKDFHKGLDLIRNIWWNFLLVDERNHYLSEEARRLQKQIFRFEFEIIKSKLQTHLSHAEADLIEVDNLIDDLELIRNSIKIGCGDAFNEHPLPKDNENVFREIIKDSDCLIRQKQLRKSEIEENIREIKEALK